MNINYPKNRAAKGSKSPIPELSPMMEREEHLKDIINRFETRKQLATQRKQLLDEAKALYTQRVYALSEKQNISQLSNFELRGQYSYHLDHIIPIDYGFKHDIPTAVISHIKNLRFVPHKDNRVKHSTAPDNVDDLLFELYKAVADEY